MISSYCLRIRYTYTQHIAHEIKLSLILALQSLSIVGKSELMLLAPARHSMCALFIFCYTCMALAPMFCAAPFSLTSSFAHLNLLRAFYCKDKCYNVTLPHVAFCWTAEFLEKYLGFFFRKSSSSMNWRIVTVASSYRADFRGHTAGLHCVHTVLPVVMVNVSVTSPVPEFIP